MHICICICVCVYIYIYMSPPPPGSRPCGSGAVAARAVPAATTGAAALVEAMRQQMIKATAVTCKQQQWQ